MAMLHLATGLPVRVVTVDHGLRPEAAAEAAGRRFPLSLASEGSATLGGVISTNAGGVVLLGE